MVAGIGFADRDGLFARVTRGNGPGEVCEAEERLVVWLVDTKTFEFGFPRPTMRALVMTPDVCSE